MFGKKKQAPPPPQVFEQQYSDQQSQPLIEEVDSTYEPTQKQVRQYAIQTLGMKLPEDESLLYLARQGLKAPITANWVPYQSRNGQIYYKHNITQEKTYDHPTDIQYRKKYQQFKEKAARKNLKSMAFKQNMAGVGGGALPINHFGNPLSLGGLGVRNNSGLGNLSNLSGISGGDDLIEPTIDQELLREYEEEFEEYERKQEKQWRQFQQEVQEAHHKRIKRIKEEYEEQKAGIQNKGQGKSQLSQTEKQQKRLEQQLQEAEQSSLAQQLRVFQNQENHKLEQYKLVFEEDKRIKLNKLQQELEQSYQQKLKLLQQKLKKLEQKKNKDKEMRAKALKEAKQELEKPDNPQIVKLLQSTLEDNLSQIKKQYGKKLRQKQEQVQRQLVEMRKIMGVDKSQNLLLLANKKEKLLSLSIMKLSAKRNKQIQAIQAEYEALLQQQKTKLKQRLMNEHELKLKQKKQYLNSELQKQKAKMEVQYNEQYAKSVQQMYQNTAAERSAYENQMNKKMSEMRMEYIGKITGKDQKKDNMGNQVVNRVLIQERQKQISNKEQLVNNLDRQLEIQRKQLKALIFDVEVSKIILNSDKNQTQLTQYLKSKLSQNNLTYNSPQLIPIRQKFSNMQQRYKQDKKLLVTMLRAIQDTSAYNIAQMRKNMYNDGQTVSNSTNGALIKKYNQDVRKMRENQQILNKIEFQLKKAELSSGDVQAIQQLRKLLNQHEYKPIGLKTQMQKLGYSSPSENQVQGYRGLKQIQQKQDSIGMKKWSTGMSYHQSSSNPPNTMQQALRQHSQFLSNVKNELNKKLYQVRYDYRY